MRSFQFISIRIIEMMRNYAQSFLGQQCPFYRPNPYNKFTHLSSPSTKSKPHPHNFTLPLQSRIEDLKLNNPFRNNISISSITSSKIPYSSYKKQIQQVKSIWKKDENQLEYNVAPRKMEDSFVRTQKEVKNLENKRISIALQESVNQEESREFFGGCEVEDMGKSKKGGGVGERIGERVDSYKMVQSSRKSTSNFKKSLARYASNNEEVVSKTHFENQQEQVNEEIVLIQYQPFYGTKIKKRKINF